MSARLLCFNELFRVSGTDELFRSVSDIVIAKNRSVLDKLLGRLGYERYRGELLVLGKKTRDHLNKYIPTTDLSKLSKEELKSVISKALSEAKDPEVVKSLQQVQVAIKAMETAPNEVIPIVIGDTGNELVLAVASTVPLTQLSREQIRELGLDERELTARLRPMYIEEKVVVPITVPKEVTEVVTVPASDFIPFERSETVMLRPSYEVVSQPVPIYVPREITEIVYVPEVSEYPMMTSETITLRPSYDVVPQPVPITVPKEVTEVITVPEVVESVIERSEEVVLKPVYEEVTQLIPILSTVEKVELKTVPEVITAFAEGKQFADVVFVPVEVPTFIEVYAPYTEPLPAIPPHLPAIGTIPGIPIMPKPTKEELVMKPETKKPKEVEKIVL
jgi:hypothetical protein